MTTNFVYPLWERSTRANTHVIYAQIRREDPVHRAIGPSSGNPIWFLTRYEDCTNFLKDQRFGKELWDALPREKTEKWGSPPPEDDPFAAVNYHLLELDPPDHTRLRALVHKAFTPRMVENLRPRIQQIADDLLGDIGPHGEIDLIERFAFPLPIIVIAEMLGIPPADRERFRDWTKTLLFGADVMQGQMAVMEFVGYMHDQIDQRIANPRDDLLTGLIQAEEDGNQLTRMELLSMIFLLLVAGHETTVNLIGNGTLALMRHPDQMRKLQANPELIRNAVEEMLRYDGPVETTTLRWAFEDVLMGDKVIEAGDMVLAALHAANRDPAVFDDPDTFDITRDFTHAKHIAFGNGIHYCLGAPLARLEGTIAINALLKHAPGLELNTELERLVWNKSMLLHGLESLPVRF
ncbi:MAG: cytochrome P450 [Anaerolineae bacterium]